MQAHDDRAHDLIGDVPVDDAMAALDDVFGMGPTQPQAPSTEFAAVAAPDVPDMQSAQAQDSAQSEPNVAHDAPSCEIGVATTDLSDDVEANISANFAQ